MNWEQAIDAMRTGYEVCRVSEKQQTRLPNNSGTPIFKCGVEPCRLVAAWSDSQTPVLVFQGAWSKCMFVPCDEHIAATDWEKVL